MRNVMVLSSICLTGLVLAADVELPAAARKSFDAKYPGATGLEVKAEVENGKTNYEVEFKDAKGTEREVELTADGQIVSEAIEVKTADLPKPVSDIVAQTYPASTIKEAKLETENGTQTYELEVKTATGELDVEVAADGSKILKSKAEKDDDDEKNEKKK